MRLCNSAIARMREWERKRERERIREEKKSHGNFLRPFRRPKAKMNKLRLKLCQAQVKLKLKFI